MPLIVFAAALAALPPDVAAQPAAAPAAAPASPASPAASQEDKQFVARADVQAFVREMAERHGFAEDEVTQLLSRARRSTDVLRLISPPAPTFKRSWAAYRARFIEPVRIRAGLRFWDENADALTRAAAEYGVPEEVIVGIIGVETIYGRNTGSFRVVDALATLAFDYPRRADYFRGELEQYLLYARESKIDPMSVRGSFAGAIGLPQFMPRSLRAFATDFDGDGRIDLRGSVAKFLQMHGWQRGGRTHYAVRMAPDAGVAPLVDAGIEPRFTVAELEPYGVKLAATGVDAPMPAADEKLALIDLPNADDPTTFLLGAQNFYVVTRYNRSSFYAMAVIELAETLKAQRVARLQAAR